MDCKSGVVLHTSVFSPRMYLCTLNCFYLPRWRANNSILSEQQLKHELNCVAKLWLPLLVNGDLPSMFLAWERRITPTQITNWNSSLENPPTPKNCRDSQSFFFPLGIGLVASFAHVIELIVELEIGACVPQWLLKCFRIIFFL